MYMYISVCYFIYMRYIYIYHRNFSKIGCNVIVDVHLELQKRGSEGRSARNAEDEHERGRENKRERERERQRAAGGGGLLAFQNGCGLCGNCAGIGKGRLETGWRDGRGRRRALCSCRN